MSSTLHRLVLSLMVVTVAGVLVLLVLNGSDYYTTRLEERAFHADHQALKPGGVIGHGLGIAGSMLMIVGVSLYMARKRYRFMSRWGLLKYWLEFHIFLCTLGPILVLFHTAYKFGGLVAVSFWSMVAVFLSGIAGRFIYLQIPRSMEGRELSLGEIRALKSDLSGLLKDTYKIDEEKSNLVMDSVRTGFEAKHTNLLIKIIRNRAEDRSKFRQVRKVLKSAGLRGADYRKVLGLVKAEIALNRRIERLETMQNLFKYWHVAHLPFALVMLIIMFIHVGVTILFGYRWIF